MSFQSDAKFTTVPAPVGGLNAFSALAAMEATDAIGLRNLIPQMWGCTVRPGFQYQANQLPGVVETLFPYAAGANKALFAFSGGGVYDVSSVVSAPTAVLSGMTNNIWSGVNYATSGGNFATLVNGDDDPIVVTGPAAFERLVAGNGTDPYTISGVDPTTWVQVTSHQRRLWFTQKGTAVAWYLPTDSIYGVAKPFDVGPLFKRGGTLRALATWTIDSGEGSNDHLVFVSDQGEVVVYGGIDVDTQGWQLQGLYYIGKLAPGRRIAIRLAGDIFILSTTGMVSLNEMVASTQVNATAATVYSKKIQLLVSELVSNPKSQLGWEMAYSPGANFLFMNVPGVDNNAPIQLGANTLTSSWCVLAGMSAYCWAEFDGGTFFGTYDGRVFRAFVGNADYLPAGTVIPSEPQPIRWFARQAYSYLEAPALQKQVGLFRLNFLVGRPATIQAALSYDFYPESIGSPSLGAAYEDTLWDEGIWNEDYWGGGLALQRDWIMGEGMGVAVSLTVSGTSNDEIIWASTDYTYQVGGAL